MVDELPQIPFLAYYFSYIPYSLTLCQYLYYITSVLLFN